MSGENIVQADFSEHRKQVAQENSPFGPIRTGLIEIDYASIDSAESTERPPVKRSYNNYLIGITGDPYNPALNGYDF